MMRSTCLAALATVALSTLPARAEGPGSFAQFTQFGTIRIDAAYAASDACQAILSVRRGAPPGTVIGTFNVPVEVVVGPDPKGCGGSRVVRRVFQVSGKFQADLLEIFFETPGGRILKHEKVAIQPF